MQQTDGICCHGELLSIDIATDESPHLITGYTSYMALTGGRREESIINSLSHYLLENCTRLYKIPLL